MYRITPPPCELLPPEYSEIPNKEYSLPPPAVCPSPSLSRFGGIDNREKSPQSDRRRQPSLFDREYITHSISVCAVYGDISKLLLYSCSACTPLNQRRNAACIKHVFTAYTLLGSSDNYEVGLVFCGRPADASRRLPLADGCAWGIRSSALSIID